MVLEIGSDDVQYPVLVHIADRNMQWTTASEIATPCPKGTVAFTQVNGNRVPGTDVVVAKNEVDMAIAIEVSERDHGWGLAGFQHRTFPKGPIPIPQKHGHGLFPRQNNRDIGLAVVVQIGSPNPFISSRQRHRERFVKIAVTVAGQNVKDSCRANVESYVK